MKTSINPIRKSLASLTAALTLLMAAGGFLQTAQADEADVFVKKVNYSDLNLESEKGARILLARLRLASGEVCGVFASPELSMRQRWQECVDKAMAGAVTKINSTAVTTLYARIVHAPQG
jgi:UrcA family protein